MKTELLEDIKMYSLILAAVDLLLVIFAGLFVQVRGRKNLFFNTAF